MPKAFKAFAIAVQPAPAARIAVILSKTFASPDRKQ
jgi:hypothetical protein